MVAKSRARAVGYVTLLMIAAARLAAGRTVVWIDTDASIGLPLHEADDGFALVLALRSTELRIAGISTSYGNAPLAQTTAITRRLVSRYGKAEGLTSATVNAGAPSPRERGTRTAASAALAAAITQHSHLTYVALAPLTNLKDFVETYPALVRRIDRVLFVGGGSPGTTLRVGPGASIGVHDANVFKDPAAVDVILRAGIPLTLLPVETSARLSLDATDIARLRNSRGAGEYLARSSAGWFWFWTHLAGSRGAPIFDALAVVAAARPDLIATERRYAELRERSLIAATSCSAAPCARAQFCTGFSTAAKRLVVARLSQQPPER